MTVVLHDTYTSPSFRFGLLSTGTDVVRSLVPPLCAYVFLLKKMKCGGEQPRRPQSELDRIDQTASTNVRDRKPRHVTSPTIPANFDIMRATRSIWATAHGHQPCRPRASLVSTDARPAGIAPSLRDRPAGQPRPSRINTHAHRRESYHQSAVSLARHRLIDQSEPLLRSSHPDLARYRYIREYVT